MAGFTALTSGDWNDPNIWFDPLMDPPTPAGPPGAGDIASIDVAGTFTGNGSVQTVMIVDASVTFTGFIAASSDFDLTNVVTATAMTVITSAGISAGHQLEVGASTKLTATGKAQITGPNSGTIGVQDFGVILLNTGSITTNLLNVVGTLDVENGAAKAGTLDVGTAAGNTGSLMVASGGSVIDTVGTVGLITNGSGIATINGGRWDNQQLTIGAEGGASVAVSNGGSVTAQGGGQALVIGEGVFAHATLSVDGATAAVTGDLGVGLRGTGIVELSAGGEMTVSGSLDAGGSALLAALGETTGIGDFDINGGGLAVGADAALGDGAAATMTLAGGGSVGVGGTLTLGALTSGTGTLALSGANARVQTDGLVVGGAGIGSATLGDQTDISTSSDVVVGASQGTVSSGGTLTLMSGSSLSDGGNLTVGDGGTGVLAVDGGSLSLLGSAFIVGNAASGNGDVSIQNVTVSMLGTVTMGNAGRASFSVNTRGGLTATSIIIGNAIGGNGGFALDGTGSSTHSGDITVGAAGVGNLQVTDSAALFTAGAATIASEGGPVQQTTTIDTKASWQVGGLLEVGLDGSAELAVQGAGQVSAAQVVAGEQDGTDGTITVSGSVGGIASALSFGSSLVIGDSGSGTLQVTDGGSVGAGLAGTGTVAIGALSGGSGVVTLSGSGSRLSTAVLAVGGDASALGGAGTLAIGVGATVAVSAATIWPTGTVVMDGGALTTDPVAVDGTLSGFGAVSGAVSNAGAIVASSGTLAFSGALSGTGAVNVETGGTLRLASAAAAGETIDLASGATLVLDDLTGMKATIAGFQAGDGIAVNGISADGETYAAGVLTLSNAGLTVGSLAISGNFTDSSFSLTSSASGVAITAACFAGGTRIATTRGNLPVEALRVGDQVITVLDGRCRPIVWIGQRAVNCRSHPHPETVWPVRVAAGAFGHALPERDLWLSPDHALFVEDVLVPVKLLINGISIAQVQRDRVAYFHVELPRHDVVLAEGLPTESYLDVGGRASFANGGGLVTLHPDFATRVWEAEGCAPLMVSGTKLEAARRLLNARALRMAESAATTAA